MKKKGFTLVELLAVIVILAVILIIAMPRISDVIKNSKEASLETTAKLIASQAEKKYTENQVLDGSSAIKCSDVAKISSNDYESCNITFDDKGNAKVTIVGKGKFEGMAVYDGTKDSAKASAKKDIVETAAKYFSYEEVNDDDDIVKTTTMSSFEVEDVNKCTSYLQTKFNFITEEQATTLCNGGAVTENNVTALLKDIVTGGMPSSDYETAGLKVETVDIIIENVEVKDENKCKSYYQTKGASEENANSQCTTEDGLSSLKDNIVQNFIPLMDYETSGLNVTYRLYVPTISITGYNIAGGTDVVIPSQIDGKTVVAIGDYAFTNDGVIPTGTAYNNDYKVSLLSYNSNNNNYIVKPLAVQKIGGLGITSVVIPNTVTSIGRSAFEGNKLTNIEIPSSITEIGVRAFADNPNIVITNNSSIENTKEVWVDIYFSVDDDNIIINGNVISIKSS